MPAGRRLTGKGGNMAFYSRPAEYWDEFAMHGAKKKILFEGDSWFSIPDIANIPVQVDSALDLSILCTADPGDTLEDLTEGTQFKMLESLIKDDRFGQQWDALVFSACGNDVIGPEIAGLLRKPSSPSQDPKDYLDTGALTKAFALMKKRLLTLCNLRDKSKVNKKTPIFMHTYSYLTPRNAAHKVFAWKVSGPWVFPHMTALGITDCAIQQAIVAELLDRFHDLLKSIEKQAASNFHVLDARRALKPVPCAQRDTSSDLWRDEIHPSSRGFRQITTNVVIPGLKAAGVL